MGSRGSLVTVKSNQGAAGLEGQSIEEFERDLKKNLYRIWNRMSSRSYFPAASADGEDPESQWRRENVGDTHLPFERYADDIIVHGRTEREGNLVRVKIAARLKQCGLE